MSTRARRSRGRPSEGEADEGPDVNLDSDSGSGSEGEPGADDDDAAAAEYGSDSASESDGEDGLRTPQQSSARRRRLLEAARASPIAATEPNASPFSLPMRSELPQYRFRGLQLAAGSPQWWSRSPKLVRPEDGRGSAAPPDAGARRRARERRETTLLRAPVRTLGIFSRVAAGHARAAAAHVASHQWELVALALAAAAAAALHVVPGPHREHLPALHWAVAHATWWIGLGVMSSVGLGTGLHTFLLFLGPHIAKVAMAASECGTLDFDMEGEFAYDCPEGAYARREVGLGEVTRAVALPSFLWGLGTALGELPPYFIAKAARAAGQKLAEMEELETLEKMDRHGEAPDSLGQRLKVWVLESLEDYGFFAIVLLASVPNPLFDLAGLACGSLGVPLATFLGATFVGKALIKVFLQAAFVTLMFGSRQIEDFITNRVAGVIPRLGEFLHATLEAQRRKYHEPHVHHAASTASWATVAWDTFLILMIGSFVVSIVDSAVQGHLADEESERRRRRANFKGPRLVAGDE